MRFSFSTTVVTLDAAGERHWNLPEYLAESRAGDELGFFMAYKGERRGHGPHSGRHGVVNNAQMIALYGLANTRRIGFGTGVVLLPLYHPVTVIQDATMIHNMYPGRYRLTVGAGYQKDDFDVFGIDLDERVRRMQVGLEAINAYRAGEPYAFAPEGPWQGLVPPPDPAMDRGFPEVWVGGWSPAGVRLAALGDGWETGPISNTAHLAHLANIYRQECDRLGKTPRIALLREACIADTDQEARELLGPAILDYHRIYFERGNSYTPRWDPWVAQVSSASEITLDHIIPGRALCGSPASWIEQLQEWEELIQPEEIVLRLRYFHGPSLDIALEGMKMVSNQVMPAFSDLAS